MSALCNATEPCDRLNVMRHPCVSLAASALLLGACAASHQGSTSSSPTSSVPRVRSHIGVRVVSGVDHFGHHYGGPVATEVLAVRSDGLPGDYTLSARFPACQTKHVLAGPGREAFVRLNCALP
jgi:hypothetical protein